jgi:predicted DNA-binding ribbon-helix-helix protein
VATSIRLESLYWQILEEIGKRDGLGINQLITRLHDELIDAHGEVDNFASFLRVCCGRYLMLQLAGRIPADLAIPIRSLDPAFVLAGEPKHGANNAQRPMRAKSAARQVQA